MDVLFAPGAGLHRCLALRHKRCSGRAPERRSWECSRASAGVHTRVHTPIRMEAYGLERCYECRRSQTHPVYCISAALILYLPFLRSSWNKASAASLVCGWFGLASPAAPLDPARGWMRREMGERTVRTKQKAAQMTDTAPHWSKSVSWGIAAPRKQTFVSLEKDISWWLSLNHHNSC